MNDVDYRARQLKSISVQAKRMNRTGKGAVRMPSDYLTKGELKKMSGEVKSYKLGEPMSKEEFERLPIDLKQRYISNLQDLYGMTNIMFGQMLGVGPMQAGRILIQLGIKPVNSKRLTNQEREIRDAKWAAFCNGVVGGGDSSNSTIEPENDVAEAVNDVVEVEPNRQEDVVELVCKRNPDPVALFQKLSFSTETDRDGLIRLIYGLIDSGKSYKFNFEAVAL